MTDWRFDRYRTAYLAMARRAKYRPAAPSDGMTGELRLTDRELADTARLEREARSYAADFLKQDDAMHYPMGCPDGIGNRAFCYAIEAAPNALQRRPGVCEAPAANGDR